MGSGCPIIAEWLSGAVVAGRDLSHTPTPIRPAPHETHRPQGRSRAVHSQSQADPIICEAVIRIMTKISMLVCATKHSGASQEAQKQKLIKMINKTREYLQYYFQVNPYIDMSGADEDPPRLEIELHVAEGRVSKIIRILENAAHSAAADSYILVRPTVKQANGTSESSQGIPQPMNGKLPTSSARKSIT